MPWHLSIVSPQFVAALIFVAFGGWALWRRVRHGRSRRTATAAAVAATILSVAAVANLVNAYFGYLPELRDVTNVVAGERNWPPYAKVASVVTPEPPVKARYPDGVTVHLAIPDRGSGFGASKALVYLPPQYFSEPTERFPVVYLFHGSPGVPGDWFRGGEAAEAAKAVARQGHPVIIVSPRMSHGWLDDPECVDGIKEKVETHLVRDVIPTVDHALRTIADRNGRTFGGMSAGGYCALNLGLRHRDLVSTIIDMSGFTKPTHDGGMRALFGPITPAVQRTIDANTPALYASSLPADPPMRVWLDCGTDDGEVLHEMTPIAATLRSRGLTVEWRVRAGAHTFGVWQPALQEALPWSQGLPLHLDPTNPSRPGPLPRR